MKLHILSTSCSLYLYLLCTVIIISDVSISGQTVMPDICNMSLISVSENENEKRVKCKCEIPSVDCSYLEIQELPLLISFPRSVYVAKLQGNYIENIKNGTFYNGREVITLDLSKNRINFVSASGFKAFTKLRRLDLSHNNLWNIPVEAMQGLPALTYLDLSFNALLNLLPDIFNHLENLRELKLRSNHIQELGPRQFEHLSNLEVLDLAQTSLKIIPDHLFVYSKKLKYLSLAENMLPEVPSEALRGLDHLKILDLSGNHIESIGQEAFAGLTGLTELHLERMSKLLKIENFAFGDMIHLQELHCSHNFLLSEIDGDAFVRNITKEKVPLSQLILRQNALRSIPPNLLDWNQDMEIHLRDNPWECYCDAIWLIHLKLKNDFQSHIKCETPSHLKGEALSKLMDRDVTCDRNEPHSVMMWYNVLLGLLVVLLIALGTMVAWKFYRGRKLYSKVSKKAKTEVSYHADSEWQ